MATSVSRQPPVPPISNEGSVINWFLAHDKQLNGLRANFPDQIAEVAKDIRGVLIDTADDGESLQATVMNISRFVTEFMPGEMALYQRGGPYSDDEIALLFACELAGAKLRILGYFLKEKHGIAPPLGRTRGASTSEAKRVNCGVCGKKNRFSQTARKANCGGCGAALDISRSVGTDVPSPTPSTASSSGAFSLPIQAANPQEAFVNGGSRSPGFTLPIKESTPVNPIATWGMWLGVVSVFLPLGLLPILAIVFSGIGLAHAKERGIGRGKAIVGLTLGCLYTLVYLRNYGYLGTL